MTDTIVDENETLTAIEGRRSVRGYLKKPVPRATIERLLRIAARAPSGNNVQPWKVHVLTGAAKGRLTAAILAHRATAQAEPTMEYAYYPGSWPEPYLSRRREVGWALYGLLGIRKGDRAAGRAWHNRNFDFFGAPVGMIVTVDRRLGQGALIDIGMFLEALVIAARAVGLETCVQAAFAGYHALIRQELRLPDEDMVVCGLALGFEDSNATANKLRTTRVAVGEFTMFHDA